MERQYGVLKRLFPILVTGMQLYRLNLVQKVITVCCMLHNLCIDFGDVDADDLPLPPHVNEEFLNDNVPPEPRAPTPPQIRPLVRPGRQPIAREGIVNVFAERLAAGIRIPNAAERRRRREQHEREPQQEEQQEEQ